MTKNLQYPKDRVCALIDGIFAFAMTLLVLTIEVPDVPMNQLGSALFEDIGKFGYYVLSFFLLSVFWISNVNKFREIKTIDYNFLWLNLGNLIFIVFIPFSTQLIGKYGDNLIAVNIFNFNLFMAGLFSYFIFQYAHSHQLFLSAYQKDEAKKISYRLLVVPVISLLAFMLSFFYPDWSTMVFIFVPIILRKMK